MARGAKIVVPANDLHNVIWDTFERHVSSTIYEDDIPTIDELEAKLKGKRTLTQYDLYQMTNSLEWADGPLDEESNEQFTEYLWSALTHEDSLFGPYKERFWDEDIDENAVGGVSSPAATTLNTPGVGNAQPAPSAGLNTDGPSGSGDKWDDSSIGMQTNEDLNEVNLNPYDKIGAMMAKKMGTPQVFKQGDSRTNTVKQDHWNELDEDQEKDPESMDDYVASPDKHIKNPKKKKFQKVQEADMGKFRIETLDDYVKASKHVPDHPLTKVKKGMPKELSVINEDNPRENEALKDISAKDELSKLGIAFEFKEAKSGMNRTFITDPISEVMEKIEQSDWEEYGKNPENTIRKWTKGDKILTIFAEGKDLPRATLTAKANESAKVIVKKIVPNSLDPYL